MKLIEDENLVEAAIEKGARVVAAIEAAAIPAITEIRARGLMIGLQLDDSVQAKDVMTTCRERGLIICIAKNNVLRVAPPLTIDTETLDAGIGILLDVLKG
ncbi:MAG: aminotransferase class III-fold pyridoxal phosphate-dependent enzyme [Rhodospirillaceae bacterium]|nr:aminotransferase class III-fold pyridoxal phosphate-dependent enzyme [Rhodospirillaceae bacterium]